jgi:hypothetical protein
MNIRELQINHDHLRDLCRRYHVARLEVFGSFARGDADSDSDLDILVTLDDQARVGLGFIELKEELERMFGRPVDLLTRSSVERSPNKYFRRFTLEHTERIYESA